MSWVFGKGVIRHRGHQLGLEKLASVERSGDSIPVGESCAGGRGAGGARVIQASGQQGKVHEGQEEDLSQLASGEP